MISFISNSKKPALLMAFIALLLLGPAVILVNAFTSSIEANAGDLFGIQRIRSVAGSIDLIANTPGNTVLVFGSSLVNEGFSPRQFDQRAELLLQQDITSFNIGMGNMKPSYQLLLAKRLREAHLRAGKRARLAVIELTPFLLTKRRNAFRPFMTEQIAAVFMSNEELWDIAWHDPGYFARLLCIRYLRNGISAEAITGGLRVLFNAAQTQAPKINAFGAEELAHMQTLQHLQKQLRNFIAKEHPLTGKSHVWNPATQGGPIDMTDLSPAAQEVVTKLTASMRATPMLARDLQERIDCCDILGLEFDESMIEEFIAIVEELKAVSDHVEIVLFPVPPSLAHPEAEALDRQHAVVQRIIERTGAHVRNYQFDPAFDDSLFYDATHLSMDKGRIIFSHRLAEDLVETLR